MSESQFNYTVIEKMHKSPIWDNHILKVRVRGKDKIYVLKLYGGINEPFQKLVFNREMEALKVLNSCSNIVKIRDTTASLKYNGKSNYGAILMDYVDGKTLDLYDWHLFTQLKKYEICLKILQAVYNAHANDVIHRDLKPQNIIYDDVNDEITIIDFGSSKIKTIIEKETTMPMFSENYSAPEVVKGNDITEKCDYYSLGVIFSELFLCKEAESNVETICLIEKSSMDEVLKDMLCSMLQDNPSDRPESIDEITDVFTQLIGELNTSANDYSVFIDFEKMRYLKRSMVIENSMNMTQFTNSFLKREFSERYGYYDEHHGKYIITGKNIVVECSYDEKIESFEVMRIFEVATDRRNINIRRSFKIEGKLSFCDSRFRYTCHNGKDNKKLWIMFKNRREENERYREREEKFDKLFGSWQEGLEESIISEKDKVAKIVYSESYIDNGQIVLEVDECQNKSIDELEQNTKFIIEGVDDRGQPVYFELGILDDIICDDDSVKIVIQMPKKVLKGNVRTLLKKKSNVMEDFRANTSSYKRQMEFDYVIIDEAAKATTPELLVSIIKAKKIILVGDQNQLPAYADQSISPKIAKLTKNPEYRMFDILFETLPNSHKQVLSTQYRMIRNIGNLISTVFYGGTIDTGCKDEDKLHGLSRYEGNSIIWFDTSENRRRKQKKTKGNSFMNEEEKRIILDILEDLKKSNELDNQDIGIITGYSGQKDILRNSVKAIGYDKIAQIDINVLDAFQGRENDIIMYSTVRTDNSIGFQKEKERVNVAFSRAKKLLIICGDLNFFYNYNDPNNKFIEIIDYIRTHDHCKIISCKGGNLF